MRLTTVILIASLMQVSASTLAQRITLSEKNATLVKVFEQIRLQSGFDFMFNASTLKDAKKVSIEVKNAELKEVLAEIFDGQPLAYEIAAKSVIVSKKEASFLDKASDVILNLLRAIDVRGVVVDEKGLPLPGATVKVKGSDRLIIANSKGEFHLPGIDEKAVLVISFLGFESREVNVAKDMGTIQLNLSEGKLEEVEVVSTGYQNIPKDRATGSFTVIDNKVLNRAVSPDLLSRLNGITNGLLVDSFVGNPTGISIRGRSTIFSNTTPLIVIDNFPYEGDLNAINPNDIENVTVLKDAAAASIWGVRAGNGVIVITTKKGSFNQKTEVNFNSNVTLTDKPDLYYQPQLSSAEWIDIEKFLFAEGKYVAELRDNYSFISPVIELLSKRTDANAVSIDAQVEALKQYDIRDQIDKYFYRTGVQQQYFLNLNGGGTNNTYNYSVGYDRNDPVEEGVSRNRYTVRGANTYRLLDNKLQITAELALNRLLFENDAAMRLTKAKFPYEQLATADGIPLPVSDGILRASYTDVAGNGKLLDWKYRPLEELRLKANRVSSESTDIRFNTGISYKILTPLSISANYQHFKSAGSSDQMADLNSYSARNNINTYTQINETTGEIKYPWPKGNTYSESNTIMSTNYGRIQLDFQKQFLTKHSFNAIVGYEIRSEKGKDLSVSLYGYDPSTKKAITRDNQTTFPFFYNSSGIRFSANGIGQSGTINNYISYYASGSYVFDDRYILSGSFRKDESNLFGVNTNQKGVPLWSTGLAWNIDKEAFYHFDFLQQLQLKGSFGYNGNVNKSVSAYTTATPSVNRFNSPYLSIINPPNPSLRWERVENINLGLYFGLKKSIVTGSIELYLKNGMDLIGTSPIAPQSGVIQYTGNVANTKTRGMDLQLNSRNIDQVFKWSSNFILNISKDKITSYMQNTRTNLDIITNSSYTPNVGYPITSIFSYKSTVLDQTGNPQGFYNSAISTDYTKIMAENNISALVFHGSVVPTVFGGFRNSFGYKEIELSINISYKMGYYYRREVLQSGALFSGSYDSPEYNQRWQKPGDETHTRIPSLVYPVNSLRDGFYKYSDVSAEKGDHIRLGDVKISYFISDKLVKRIGLKSLQFYGYASNLGIIWAANNKGLDPDVRSGFPTPKNISLGFKTIF